MTTGIYVLNAGDAIPTGSITSTASNKGLTAPTNPTIIEFDSGGAQTNDLNCFEIWDARGSANANTINGVSSSALNREYPISTDTLSHQTTLSTTPGYKIHSDVTLSTIISGGVLKTANDYFVLVHSDNGNKHHFAKITEVIKYDTMGDGFEFEPRLKEDIPAGTKFAIFRGPDTTDASYNDLVAVGYGLTSTGNKHNHVVNVSRPTFYFYNDHIDNPINNELAHNTKYEVVKSRYVSSSSTENNNICFLTTPSFGPRLLDKSPFKQTIRIVDENYNDDISTAGSKPHFAGSYTNDQTTWDNCFRNSSRAVYTNTAPGTLNTPTRSGPSNHLRLVESPELTKVLENIESVNVSKTITVSGNYAELKIFDFEKILDEKVKINDDFKVRSVLYEQKFSNNYNVNLPGKVNITSGSTAITFTELNAEHDLRRILGTGETIKIENRIYIVGSIGARSGGEQILTIDGYKNLTDTTFTSAVLLPEDLTSVKAFRRPWSGKQSNLMTNANIDTEIDGSGNITRNGIALTTSEVDYNNLDVVVSDGDLRSYRFSVEKADKNNQYFELDSTSTGLNIYQYGSEQRANAVVTTNSTKYIAPIIHYISTSGFIDNVVFDGTVEYIQSETQNSQMKYTITGRDDIGKLLSRVNNKKYLYSDEYVYTTEPPFGNFTYTGYTIDASTDSAGTLNVDITRRESDGAIYTNDLIFYKDVATATGDNPSNYIFLGISTENISAATDTLTFSNATFNTVNLAANKDSTDSNYNKYVTTDVSSSDAKLYAIRNQISLGKGLGADITKSSHATTLKGSSDKGINFISGRKLTPITGADDGALPGSKSSGYTLEDATNSLGYSISTVSEIETGKLSPETTTIFNHDESSSERITTVSSMAEYAILDTETVDKGLNKIIVAPLLPVVLGRVDSNTSSTKVSNLSGIYLINKTGLPNGGYLHLLNSETIDGLPITFNGRLLDDVDTGSNYLDDKVYADYTNRFGPFIWRYVDLQSGKIYYEDEIANRQLGTSKSVINGVKGLQIYKDDRGRFRAYATGVRLNGLSHGFDTDASNSYLKEGSPETRGPMPALGSNFADVTILPVALTAERNTNTDTKEYEKNWGLMVPNESKTINSVARFPFDIDKYNFEANDPKVVNLHLLCVGDVLPDSKKRPTHIGGVSNRNFSDYSIIFKRDGAKEIGDEHQKYSGALESNVLIDDDYSIQPITSASITPDAINRFGVIRLVELTMDWHYNAVDIENIKENKSYKDVKEITGGRIYKWPVINNSNDNDFYGVQISTLGTSTASNSTTGTTQTLALNTDKIRVPRGYAWDGLNFTHVSGGTAGKFKFSKVITKTQSCGIENTDATVTTDTTNLSVGMSVTGTGIPGSTNIASINSPTSFELSNAATATGTETLTFGWTYDYSDFTTAGSSSGVTYDVDNGLMFEVGFSTATGQSIQNAIIKDVAIDSTHVELGFISNRAFATGTSGSIIAGTAGAFIPITAWQKLYDTTPVKLGEVRKIVDNGSTSTVTLAASTTAYSGNVYFQFAENDDFNYSTNTITDFNKHLITGRLLNPYYFSSRDNSLPYNNEILPESIALPITATGTLSQTMLGVGIGRGALWTDPTLTHRRHISRVMIEMNDIHFKIVASNGGAHYNSYSAYYGETGTIPSRNEDRQAFGTASKFKENMLGVVTRGYPSFSLDPQPPNLIDALNGRELGLPDEHIKVNGVVTYDGDTSITFDTEAEASTVAGNPAYTGPTDVGGGSEDLVDFDVALLSPKVSQTKSVSSLSSLSDVTTFLNTFSRLNTHFKEPEVGSVSTYLEHIDWANNNITIADNCAILVGKKSPQRLVTSGMTFPIRGFGHPRGNINCLWYQLQYAAHYKNHGTGTDGLGNVRLNTAHLEMTQANNGREGTNETNAFLYNSSNTYTNNRHMTQASGAEIFYKPVLNISGADVTLGSIFNTVDSKKRARISIDVYGRGGNLYTNDMAADDTTEANRHNRWIHFAPNLTGYYLVSEAGTNVITNTAVSNRKILNSKPTNIFKIINHRIDRTIQSYNSGGSSVHEYIRHILEIDNVSGTAGDQLSISGKFRVMRISQDTFYDFTPNTIPLLTYTNAHTREPYTNKCYTTINKFNEYNDEYVADSETLYNEGLLSMFVPIEVDGRGEYVDVRDLSDMFSDTTSGSKLVKGQSYNMHITDGENKLNTTMTVQGTTNNYSLELADISEMNGCVSFGEQFTLDIFNTPKFKARKCSIGTALHVVDEAEKVINDLLENTDITYSQTTDNAKYYESYNIQGLDTYTAANFVASLKNRKLTVDGKTINLVKDKENKDYTDIEFNEFSENNRVGHISRDNNIFDFYNQITVYGDGVKSSVRDSASIKKIGVKELEEVDLSIITQEACKRKALNLLDIHSESSAAISFKVLYDQCPYLKPGQIISINYPSEKIPRGEYIVLEINYEIGGFMDIKVGKYAKNLTNRIAELLVQGKRVDAALRGDRYTTTAASNFIQEEIALRAVKLKVQYTTATSTVANVFGFTPVFGFDTTLGIMVPTGESTQNLEYDLL
jgi:hypothetical protein